MMATIRIEVTTVITQAVQIIKNTPMNSVWIFASDITLNGIH